MPGLRVGLLGGSFNPPHVAHQLAAIYVLETQGVDAIWFVPAFLHPFDKPLEARHWLQASNPSERWKWDFMFQDLPPVKGSVDPSALPLPPGAIALKEVK